MVNHISLEDCALSVSSIPRTMRLDSEFQLNLDLPGMMDITGLPFFQRWEVDHKQHIGSSGILYIACDHLARFWSWEYLNDASEERDYKNPYFRSMGNGTKFQAFKLNGLDWLLAGLHQKDKPAVIAGINSYANLATYFRRFFEWVNEFIEIYGESRFYEPFDGVHRFTHEYHDGLHRQPMHQRAIEVPSAYLAQNINF